MARLVCPYCYDSFAEREIQFRCSGSTPRAGKACTPVRDEQLAARIGITAALPPTFDDDGRKPRALCPRCKDESSYRICPFCHSQLPVHFGKVSSRLIAMIGAKATGKTVYMTVLVHELGNRVGDRFGASVVGSDDRTLKRFGEDYQRKLYEARELFPSTPSAASRAGAGVLEPLVFSFTIDKPWPLLSNGGPLRPRTEQTLLSFFDTAGEDLTSQESVERNTRYLASADGVVLLLDPLQMPAARRLSRQARALPEIGPTLDSPLNVLSRVTRMLQGRLGLRPSSLIDKPLAIAFSKLDALSWRFPQGTPLRRPESTAAAFDRQDSLDVHEHVLALLHEWDGLQIHQLAQHSYRRFRYFGFSALGESPTEVNRVSERGIRPYRVADPFLWLLSEFGTIPRSKLRTKA
jgi:hypothetical protein